MRVGSPAGLGLRSRSLGGRCVPDPDLAVAALRDDAPAVGSEKHLHDTFADVPLERQQLASCLGVPEPERIVLRGRDQSRRRPGCRPGRGSVAGVRPGRVSCCRRRARATAMLPSCLAHGQLAARAGKKPTAWAEKPPRDQTTERRAALHNETACRGPSKASVVTRGVHREVRRSEMRRLATDSSSPLSKLHTSSSSVEARLDLFRVRGERPTNPASSERPSWLVRDSARISPVRAFVDCEALRLSCKRGDPGSRPGSRPGPWRSTDLPRADRNLIQGAPDRLSGGQLEDGDAGLGPTLLVPGSDGDAFSVRRHDQSHVRYPPSASIVDTPGSFTRHSLTALVVRAGGQPFTVRREREHASSGFRDRCRSGGKPPSSNPTAVASGRNPPLATRDRLRSMATPMARYRGGNLELELAGPGVLDAKAPCVLENGTTARPPASRRHGA